MNVPHPEIRALGFSEAGMFLRGEEGKRVGAVIAIHGQREFAVEAPGRRMLDLCFDDIAAPDAFDPMSVWSFGLQQRKASEIGLIVKPPSEADAQAIIDFAREVAELDGIVLCHCQGGISRSPAAALLCLAVWTGPGREAECVEYLQRVRSCALPHRDLVAFGDRILGRSGKLVDAVFGV